MAGWCDERNGRREGESRPLHGTEANDSSTAIWWVIVAVIFVFLFAPVVVVLLFSFNAASTTALPFAGFSCAGTARRSATRW